MQHIPEEQIRRVEQRLERISQHPLLDEEDRKAFQFLLYRFRAAYTAYRFWYTHFETVLRDQKIQDEP